MILFVSLASIALIVLVLVDAFETTVLPRRVTHRFRFARLYYITSWQAWRCLSLGVPRGRTRESFLGIFGPLSLLGLLATWVFGLIYAFALLHWSLSTPIKTPDQLPASFGMYLYFSGGTFFTLGPGDVTATTVFGRALDVLEAGMGFGFLALIIGYLPVIYQTFSQRERAIATLDARAGSPPTAAQILERIGRAGNLAALDSFLADWERWSADLLESHLSFPVLSYYRSQHDNQSWLSSLTAVLDTCAVMLAMAKEHNPFQAQLTFAIARHAAVDLALVFKVQPIDPEPNRLPADRLQLLHRLLADAGIALREGPAVEAKLTELRGMYEPFVNALSKRFLFALPPIMATEVTADNWQRSAWMKRAPELGQLPIVSTGDGHFE